MYRWKNGQLEVFLAHPGGPFFKSKDEGHWTIPKGEYLDSQEVINVVNGYGIADQGLHKAIFSPSITDSPAVDYQDPSGNRLQSRILGLAYFDRASGRSTMICAMRTSRSTPWEFL